MRLRLLLKSTILSALLLMSVSVGWGQTLLVEEFNYTAGDLMTDHGWVGHSGTGTNNIAVTASTISYTDYISSGIGNEVLLLASGQDINKQFTAQTSGNIYAALLVNVTSTSITGDYFFHLAPNTIGTAFKGRLFVKKDGSNKLAFGISVGGAANYSAFSYDLNTTYLVVVKYSIVSGTANDVVAIYINPDFVSGEPGSGWITNTDVPSDPTDIGSVAIRQGTAGNTVNVKVDGIRIATTWAEAVKANTPPAASFVPTNASTTANPDANIVITFDEAALNTDGSPIADPTSLITLKETDAAGADVAFTATINAGKTAITIDPTSVLGYNKAYYVAVAPVEDAFGKEATIQTATFSTRVQDVAAPVWTAEYPKVGAIANSDFNLLVNLDEKGKAYYVVLADGAAAPSVAQVVAGQDGTSAAALKSGTINLAAGTTEYSVNISGLTAATVYDVYVVAEDVELTPNLQASVASVLNVTTTDTKPEPSNQATDLAVAINSQTKLTLTWADATGAQLPLGYLILMNETGVFVDPVDGVAQDDATGVYNVAYGVKTKEITGLTPGKDYFFKMYSLTNTGTATDYLLTAAPTANISLPQLTFTYPNGGETFYAGDTVVLTWTSVNVTAVAVEVSQDNGTTWSPFIESTVSDGIDTVVVPADADYSNQYLLRISAGSNAAINDVPNATFTVKAVTSHLVDLLTMPNNAIVKYVGKATVTYARTSRNQKYIQDETGAVLIDDNTTAPGFITGTYAIGDGITNIEAKVFYYNGLVEFTPSSVTGEPCTGNPVITPEVRTIESLTHLDQCKLVKIENFTFATTGTYATSSAFAASKNYDITGYTNTVFAYRTLFAESDYIGLEIPLTPVTAVCLVGQFNATMQVTARNLADITSTSAEIISDVYTVVFETSVIKDVPEADDLAAFKANLTPAAGATFEVYDADGITPATVLDNTKLVICTAQDGTTKKTYTVEITVYVPSSVATLTKLMYNGTSVNGFLSGSLNYAVQLPFGTTEIPVITYNLADDKASAVITDVTNLTGSEAERTAKVEVTAEDGTTVKTYSIVFTVYVQSTNASLTKISVNGVAVSGFLSGTLNYAILLPVGTTFVPTVTYILADAKSSAVVTNATNLFGTESERTTSIAVTAEDGSTVKTYNVVFTVDNTGIANNGGLKLSAYPNPAVDEIKVSGLANAKKLELMNITGKVIRVIEINGDETLIKISDLNKGMYFLKTESQTLKFIKK